MERELKTKTKKIIVYSMLLVLIVVCSLLCVDIKNKRSNHIKAEVVAEDNILQNTISIVSTPAIKESAASEIATTLLPQVPPEVEQYLMINTDTIGHIKISNTVIDYPVVYSGDNTYYLEYDFDNLKSPYGAIFLDYRCDVYNLDKTRNIILYGHRMKDGTMFKPVVQYLKKSFLKRNNIIEFDTLTGKKSWEVFAAFETSIDFFYIQTEFASDEMWLAFINECQDKSLYKTDVVLSPSDIVLTLSTCSTDKDYRIVVMARLTK